MFLKERFESDELKILRALNIKSKLSSKERSYYLSLEKGYEGEVKFDKILSEQLHGERHVLNDLLLEVNNSYFQIDTLMISQAVVNFIDIKNFEGDFYFDSEKFHAVSNSQEYKNPLTQLTRSASLFRQLLQNLKLNYLVDASVIFIHPEFSLYKAEMDQPIILPTQLNRFLRKLKETPSTLNDGHHKLAQTLMSLHKTKNPYVKIPEYTYEQLPKKLYCGTCNSFFLAKERYELVCMDCGARERNEDVILRNIAELVLLFPELRLTTDLIYEWCGGVFCRRTIYRALVKNFSAFGNNKNKFYN